MNESNAGHRAVRRFYEAEAAFMTSEEPNFAPVGASLATDCLLCQPASLPYGGEWRGHEGVERWLRAFKKTWASMEMRDSELFGEGAIVFGRSHVHAVARGSGQRVDWPLLQFFRLRESVIVELRPFHWDTAAMLPALARRGDEASSG